MAWVCGVDWVAIASLLNAAAIVGAAYLAKQSFEKWQVQRIATRESEVAEEALSLAYEGEEVFRSIRSPMQRVSIDESGNIDTLKNYIERMNRNEEYFKRLFEILPRIRAVLGEECYIAVRVFVEVRGDILGSLEMYADLGESGKSDKLSQNEKDLLKKCRADIWQTYNKDDPLWKRTIDARLSLERILLDRVRGRP
ncbi:MAG: hypothetical protein GC201_11230 [Alphaproteobacteria bacterium]|nr:hypothetical protein [Alphaproteobacteria bacterium]